MATDWWGVEQPEWFILLKTDTPEGETPEYVKIGLDEFCGRFDLTPGKAKAEIRRCKLWNCGVHPARGFLKRPHEIGDDPFKIPLPEADRYAAIIEAEKAATTPPIQHPCLDPEHPFYAEELAVAVKAWEYAVSQKPTRSNFGRKIEAYLQRCEAGSNETVRLKTVCGIQKRGPRPSKK